MVDVYVLSEYAEVDLLVDEPSVTLKDKKASVSLLAAVSSTGSVVPPIKPPRDNPDLPV